MPPLLRPLPIDADPAIRLIDGNAPYREVAAQLAAQRPVAVTDTYGTALTLYAWLRRQQRRTHPAHDFASSRVQRQQLWRLTRQLLVPIAAHRVALRRAPEIGWLARLYPERDEFYLPLPDVLGLNGSWQWYQRGLRSPGLEAPLHPLYGVYFSPRSTHLELFDAWLAERAAPVAGAADIGVGSGPLTFLLLKHGVHRVHATDTCANAIVSVEEDLERQGLSHRVRLEHADLFGALQDLDLIVCNPPWLPGDPVAPLDEGNSYPEGWFERFFAGAAERLAPGGQLVVLFSNLGNIAGLTDVHPIAHELERGDRFRLVAQRDVAAPPSSRRQERWRQELRQRERVELWELTRR